MFQPREADSVDCRGRGKEKAGYNLAFGFTQERASTQAVSEPSPSSPHQINNTDRGNQDDLLDPLQWQWGLVGGYLGERAHCNGWNGIVWNHIWHSSINAMPALTMSPSFYSIAHQPPVRTTVVIQWSFSVQKLQVLWRHQWLGKHCINKLYKVSSKK